MDSSKYDYVCSSTAAAKIAHWMKTRGGIVIWPSINMSNLGQSFTTPRLKEDGTLVEKPNWQCSNTGKVITDIEHVGVSFDREVKRFRVAVRRSSNGISMKVTDAGSARIRAAVDKAGDGAYRTFDYETQEAVIMAPDSVVPLATLDLIAGMGLPE